MRKWRLLSTVLLILCWWTLIGCNSSPPKTNESATSASPAQQLPFSKKQPDGHMASSIPSSLTLPAGTPISIRLQEPLSSETAKAGQRFKAILDEPLVTQGVTVAKRGATVTGKILAVRRAGSLSAGGILQLGLESVDTGEQKIPLQTSSVIVSGTPNRTGGLPNGDSAPTSAYSGQGQRVAVGAQRRLTFRLNRPAVMFGPIMDQRSTSPSP
jgi:hypothetical protein